MEIKTVYGVGYSSDKTLPGKNRAVYKRWAEILRRCYVGTQNSYEDCSVCTTWHDFKNFLDWYKDNCLIKVTTLIKICYSRVIEYIHQKLAVSYQKL